MGGYVPQEVHRLRPMAGFIESHQSTADVTGEHIDFLAGQCPWIKREPVALVESIADTVDSSDILVIAKFAKHMCRTLQQDAVLLTIGNRRSYIRDDK